MKILTNKLYACQLVFILSVCLALCSCGGNGAGKADDDKPLITVTIEPVRYFAEQIGGDLINVESLVPRGSNPEAYDPTPQQMVSLSRSSLYLECGGYLGFEKSWLGRLRQNAKDTRFVNLSEGMDLVADPDDEHSIDPHIWCSCANARIMARNICSALSQFDPANRSAYQAGYDKLLTVIDSTYSIVSDRLESLPLPRAFMIFHPALTYFANEYELRQISIERDGKEPSAMQLRDIIDESSRAKVHVIFIQPEFDHRNAEAIAEQTGARLVDINPLSYDWPQEMVNIANALTENE